MNYTANSILDVDACIAVSKNAPEELYSIIMKVLDSISDYDMMSMINDSVQINHTVSIGNFILTHPAEMYGFMILCSIVFSIILMMAYHIYNGKKKSNELLEANTAKSVFVSRVSHDIRTPLNGILGMARIGIAMSESEETREQFNKIRNSGRYLLSLVNDVLDLSRIENHRLELNIMIIRVSQFFQQMYDIIKPQLEPKKINLDISYEGEFDEYARFDRIHMLQIYLNLIGNAIKFSKEGGTVEFICKNEIKGNTNYVTTIIRDHGIGMKPEFLEHMFEPFEQEENQYTKSQEGSGLGLTIVKSIIDTMKGTIHVESEVDKGTVFTIQHQIMRVTPEEVESIKKQMSNMIIQLKGKRVLLVEDNEINCEIEKVILEEREMIVEVATDGEEAIDKFEQSDLFWYDLILMDVRMPKMNGMVATSQIRSNKRIDAKSIPIIAMTADTLNSGLENVKKAGMNAYITKPINVDELYQTLGRLLS